MARLSRLAIDRQLHHVVHRARPGVDLLRADADRSSYLGALLDASRELEVAIHAYALLTDRVQLLLTPREAPKLALMMQRVGRRYVGAYNRRHGCTGTVWSGRYRTSVLQPSLYLLVAMRHVEAAPVDAGVTARPEEWPASSAAHHAGLRLDPLVTEHPEFWALGNTPFEREVHYRRLCERALPSEMCRAIDEATCKGWALGDEDYLRQLGKVQARRLLPKRRGRPPARNSPHSDPN